MGRFNTDAFKVREGAFLRSNLKPLMRFTPKEEMAPVIEDHLNVKRKLVIWGAAGHAAVVADIIRLSGEYEIIGFLDDLNPHRRGKEFLGARILGGGEQLARLHELGVQNLIVAIGENRARLRKSEQIWQYGYELAKAIHPKTIIADGVHIDDGSVVVAGAVINPGSNIGGNVIINTNASIDHGCIIEDGAHIGPGATLGGNVFVGRGAWVGIGAIVKEGVIIGEGSIIGAGAVVLTNIPRDVIAYGIPAKVVRSVEK